MQLLLAALIVAAALFTPYLGLARNRLLSPRPVSLFETPISAAPIVLVVAILVMVAMAFARGRLAAALGASAAALAIVADIASAGLAATALLGAAASPAARVSLGASFWMILIAAVLALGQSLRRPGIGKAWRVAIPTLVIAAIAAMLGFGLLDDLSLLKEWSGRRDGFTEAVLRHVLLVAVALILTLPIGAALGALAASRPERAGAVFGTLNLIQTIPSIALFGLLIEPLTALSDALPWLREAGIRGIGFTPALIALVLYALLPAARAVHAGLGAVPEATIEAARGMGFTGAQLLIRIMLPLALPALLAGLRIVTIQLVGLAVVAALIGAGGLGDFVFQGLGQTATDLVLLGALTAIGLALLVDIGLRALAALLPQTVMEGA